MPRDYNPEDSDFTLWFAKKVSNLFAQHVNTLSSSDIEKAVKVFQNDGLIPLTTPTMVIKRDCSRGHFFFDKQARINSFFPAIYIHSQNRLVICQNLIFSYPHLLENLHREFEFVHQYQVKELDKVDEEYACSAIKACKKGYDVYSDPDKQMKETMQCAKLLFRVQYRGPNTDQVPLDAWIRLTDKLVKRSWFCYGAQSV